MKCGDLVAFVKELYPRKKLSDCGIFRWKTGILVEKDEESKKAVVLCEGELITVPLEAMTIRSFKSLARDAQKLCIKIS